MYPMTLELRARAGSFGRRMTDLTYRYLAPSTVIDTEGGPAVLLSTAGGRSANPSFFSGFAERPTLTAQAILAVAEVARTRYFDPGWRSKARDPVVTSNLDVLRFESFSACNGVYARFDLEAAAIDGSFSDWGTTNVDVNNPMRTALARIGGGHPLRLSVGPEQLRVETLEGAAVERKVPLPDRWVRGFAEVSVAGSDMLQVRDFPVGPARRILRELPRQRAKGTAWVTWTGRGARLTSTPGDEAVCLAGPERLRSIARLVPQVQGLRVYAPPPARRLGVGGRTGTRRAAQPSAWELRFEGARLVLMLSPEVYRGFSGEGGILSALAGTDAHQLTAAAEVLHGQSGIDPEQMAERLGIDRNSAWSVVRALGGAGRVGFDLSAGAFFHRDLPFDRAALEALQPRLVDARELIAGGAVSREGDDFFVHSGDARYRIRFDEEGTRCTCPWFARHRGERGPCKHVIAAELVRAGVRV